MKKYRLKLRTLSNLHIGSGETLQTFDYVIENNQFHFFDVDLLSSELIKNNLENDFIKAINNITSNRGRDMKQILNGLGYSNHLKFVNRITDGKAKVDKNKQVKLNPIELFIRNGNGDLYVPGSSVKGFMNNILNLSKDEAKNLVISDSNIISEENLFISTINYYNQLYGEENQKNILPKDGQSNYVEFIKPLTEITFIVKMKEDKLNEFIKKLKIFNENYYNNFLSSFESHDEVFNYKDLEDYKSYHNNLVFRLGKYTNFLIKTEHLRRRYNSENNELYYKLRSEKLIKFPRKFEKKLYAKSEYLKMYPLTLKLSITNKNYYHENGVCEFSFEEIKWD